MTERRFILSEGRNMEPMTAVMPKSLVVRIVGFFTEKFDATVVLLTKLTNF
jgi:hypothetical protein